jgi:tetratricopeptide (TPR) repeat protein
MKLTTHSAFFNSLLGSDYSFLGDDDRARAEAAAVERAIAASPNSHTAYVALAELLNSLGKPAEALVALDKAKRLDPRSRDNYSWYSWDQGLALTLLGRPKEASPALKRYWLAFPIIFGPMLIWRSTIWSSAKTMPRGQRRRRL